MEAAARVVAREVGKAEAFRHDALPRERRVAVKEDWQDLAAVLVAALGLLRADLAEDDGVDRFQVTGVGDQRHMDADALELPRSEEHTSELQSLMRISYAVFCLKKKNRN